MTDIIEAGARAICERQVAGIGWNKMPISVRTAYFKDARAAYVAMVGAMTDIDIGEVYHNSVVSDHPTAIACTYLEAKAFRAALLKLVEVDDG